MMFEHEYRRQFEEWGQALRKDDGLGRQAVKALLSERHLVIPAALFEYYVIAGHHPINSKHNQLYSIDQLREEAGHLIFMEENQGVAFWGIASADLQHPDPIVWQAEKAESLAWFVEPYTVSQFLMAMWHWQLTGEIRPGS
ncbi:MAG: hypothetical protein ACRC8S_10370 [Fimbriiglobus sp.]